MRIGLHALGVGAGADGRIIHAVARAADERGFATLWSGEHVVMVDRPDARYPYSDDGKIAVPTDADWLDPFLALTFAAAVTTRITLATGVVLLPQHHPLVVAKQAASLDALSAGRLVLGVGIGWSSQEFAALGVPFARRAARTEEYVDVLRTVWRDDVASYDGEFVQFAAVRSYPKPVRDRAIPVVFGGNSDAAFDRVAAFGNGWYGFNLAKEEVAERVGTLTSRCRAAGREVADLQIAVSVRDGRPEDAADLAATGITELVLVEAPPPDPADVGPWMSDLAERWNVVERSRW